MRRPAFTFLAFILVVACFVVGCSPIPVSPEPQPCPQATPEWLRVEPVTSPTDELSQTVTVLMGNMEAVTITLESGAFTSTGPEVDVELLPNTVHHLEIVAKVKEIWRQGCRYGGYTLRTVKDRAGAPLIIQQGQSVAVRLPSAAIAADNVLQLEPLAAIAPDAGLTADFQFFGSDELMSVGYEGAISHWDVTTGREIGRIGDGLEEASALCVAANAGRTLIATGGTAADRAVRLWDPATGEMAELGSHDSYVESVAFSPDGTRLASGGDDNRVWIWDVAGGQAIASFEGDVPQRPQFFHSLYWPDNGTLVAAGSEAIYWWDVRAGQRLKRLARPEEAALFVDVAFGGNDGRLAAAAQDENVYVWDGEAAGWATWPARPGDRLSHVAFSPDGQLLAAATFDGELLLWSVASQELLASHSVTNGQIAGVRFSPDGRYLAVGGWDSVIGVWGIP